MPPSLPPEPRSRRRAATLLACLLGLGALASVQAATRDYYFTPIGSEQGLAQNSITALAQDAQGFVWVGTQGGLHRYDGDRYVAYRNDPGDPASLPESFVTALAADPDANALWVGLYSQYLARIDLDSGRITHFPPEGDPDDTTAARQVAAVLPHDGVVWVGTLGGLERFDPATGERRSVLALGPELLRRAPYQQLLVDRAGMLWYATAAGVFRIGPDRKAERVGGRDAAASLLLDHDGAVWVGRRDGLFRVSGDTLEKAWPLQPDASADGNSNVRAVVQVPDGSLWLSVYGSGLVRFEPGTGRSRRVHGSALPASLSDDVIGSLLVDRGGMLWVGGQSRGAAVADPAGARFSYVVDLETDEGRKHPGNDSVRAIQQDIHGTLWVGTDEGRLLRYHGPGPGFEDWTARMPGPSNRRVMGIADAGHGRLWLATTAGLLRLTPATGTFETIPLGSFTHANLRALLVDHEGNLWLATYGDGALLYQRESQRVIHYGHDRGDPRKLVHPSVHALLEDRKGRIWFGTSGGLDLLDPATGRLRHFRHDPRRPESLPGNMVRALHQDADGNVWVGTHAGLAQVVEAAPGAIGFSQPLTETLDRRLPPVVFSIASDGTGRDLRLWLGTDVGIVRFDTALAHAHRYGLGDGLQDLEFNGGAVATLADGRIAMGGVRGLNLFHPRGMRSAAYAPPLRLLAARVGADAPDENAVMWQASRLDVPDGADILRLRIGALDFAPAASTRYRYRMEGFDKGWIDNGTQSDITYTRLPPGRYTFRAQATDRDGNWSPVELQVPVHVAPPLWRHPLAITAAVLSLLALAAVLGWRWHRRRRQEQGWFQQIREREERLRLALWASGEQFWDYDLGNREVHRTRVVESYGDRPETAIHNHVSGNQAIHPEDFPLVREAMLRHLRGEVALFTSEHRTRDAEGQAWRWVRARGRVVERDADGRAVRVAGTARDTTDSRSAERERRISSEVLRSMAEAVAVFDRDFSFISINPAFTRMTGYSDVEVFGRSTSLLDSSRHDPRFYHHMRDELQRDGRWSGEMWQQRKDGGEFLCWLQASSVADADGAHDHYVAVLGDITDQKRAEQELRYLANYDTLTNLPNRALLAERLGRAVVRARTAGSRIAVLFLDLDRFKDINDSFGHATGDRILRAAAQRLQQIVGSGHTVARLSGDEFTVVLENLDSADHAERVARALIEAFQTPLDIDGGHDLVVSPSIGISLFPDHAETPADLLKHADTAMYQAKAIGRRAFMRYADSMDVEVRERSTISAALRKVLDRDELALAFQPRLSLSQDRIVSVEALLRWHSPEHGTIPPARFIPVAEETGMILEIGEWALREACGTLAQWRAAGLELGISVNVSSLQLLRGDLPSLVARVLADTGLPPGLLELELTETVIMANAGETAATLQALRAIGVKLAIDDFGTGYSSLSYLKRLPINTLKIDKDFVDDLCHDPDDAAITSTIITMGHSLGLTVVAEGVEDTGQLGFLRRHGCDEIQGYWLARPLPPEQCLELLRQRLRSTAPAV
ncbi:EAL domain-containing protein [Novilysobacter arseniciresistens]|uniref:EAL domain-containing protein n=1 Tax=Novilysobacter arseniciresistens TaxID=1385522 RepID=UPI00068C728D|nr:EAL domain-containing protein [Lysobacter arseniciresistens]